MENKTIRIEINSVSMRYNDGEIESVSVNFEARDNDREIDINGIFPLSVEEYDKNSAIKALEDKVRSKLIERLKIE